MGLKIRVCRKKNGLFLTKANCGFGETLDQNILDAAKTTSRITKGFISSGGAKINVIDSVSFWLKLRGCVALSGAEKRELLEFCQLDVGAIPVVV